MYTPLFTGRGKYPTPRFRERQMSGGWRGDKCPTVVLNCCADLVVDLVFIIINWLSCQKMMVAMYIAVCILNVINSTASQAAHPRTNTLQTRVSTHMRTYRYMCTDHNKHNYVRQYLHWRSFTAVKTSTCLRADKRWTPVTQRFWWPAEVTHAAFSQWLIDFNRWTWIRMSTTLTISLEIGERI